MKRMISLLLIAAVLCSFAACGKKDAPPAETPAPPAATTAPTPKSTPEPTPVPVEYPIIVPIGEAAEADLDGDGTAESVRVWLEDGEDGWTRACLTVNGPDFTDSLYLDSIAHLDCPDPDNWAIADIYSADGLLEIAVQDWGPSSDYYTNFFRYENGEVYPFGGVPGLIWDGTSGESDLSFEEDGFIESYMRLRVLQTWFAPARYEIAPRGMLELVPQELYTATAPTAVTVKSPVLAYAAPGDDAARTLETGTELLITGTDNAEWVQCVLSADKETQEALWLRLDSERSFQIQTPDGFAFGDAVLDGLLFAD